MRPVNPPGEIVDGEIGGAFNSPLTIRSQKRQEGVGGRENPAETSR